jgi:TolB protein
MDYCRLPKRKGLTSAERWDIIAAGMNRGFLFIVVLAVFLALPSEVASQTRPEVGGTITTGPTVELLSIAVEDFRLPAGFYTADDSLMAWDLKEIFRDDLAFSLYFNVVEADSAFLADFARGGMSIDDWIYVGAQLLVSGRIEKEREGLLFTVDITDLFRNRNIYNRDFVGSAEKYRYVAHDAAADILYNLTGEQGCYHSRLVYASDATGASEIYVCDFDGYDPIQITEDNSIDVLPSWNSDGERIFFTSYKNGNPDLFAYVFDQRKSFVVSNRAGLNSAAAVSPDGKYIACTLTIADNSEIYLLDQTGRIMRRLTFNSMIDSAPTWSPSSTEIAFTSDRTGTPQIYVTDIEGLNTRRLTYRGSYNDQASWSPRGDLIAYTSREPEGFQIYTIDITGQFPRKLTEIGVNEAPSWSPDGLHIVYSHIVDGRYQLHTMDYSGRNVRRLNLPGNCKTPEWSKNLR